MAEAWSSVDPLLSDWTAANCDAIAAQAKIRPQKIAAHDLPGGQAMSFEDLHLETSRCAAYLQRKFPEPGVRVALLARNSFLHIVLFYACARTGMIFVPLNWRLTGSELRTLVADCTPDLLIFASEFADAAGIAASQHPDCNPLTESEFHEAINRRDAGQVHSGNPEDTSLLLYTSGTTGKPKAVMLSPRRCFFESLNFIRVGKVEPTSVLLLNVPLFHTVGLMAIMNSAAIVGARILMTDRFVPEEALRQLSDRNLGITHYFCVPQIVQALLGDPAYARSDLRHLTGLFTGGAPMPPQWTQKLISDGIMAVNGYGMSECGTAIHMPLDAKTAISKLGSTGVPAPFIDVRLVGQDGSNVKRGEIGEVWLKGPGVTGAYWNQPATNEQCFTEGWFHTGDAARQDEDGFYYVVDRWKDMYISGGENVYPAEVEAALRELPGVSDAAVIGVPDAKWGESGCAFIVLEARTQITQDQIRTHCVARLAKFKHPAHIRFVNSIPRSASGKILKNVLRKQFETEN